MVPNPKDRRGAPKDILRSAPRLRALPFSHASSSRPPRRHGTSAARTEATGGLDVGYGGRGRLHGRPGHPRAGRVGGRGADDRASWIGLVLWSRRAHPANAAAAEPIAALSELSGRRRLPHPSSADPDSGALPFFRRSPRLFPLISGRPRGLGGGALAGQNHDQKARCGSGGRSLLCRPRTESGIFKSLPLMGFP